MSTASYWRSEYNRLWGVYKEYETKCSNYESYKKQLELLNSPLSSASESLKDSEKNFKNGGYIYDDETLDKGELKICYEELDNIKTTLSTVITNTQTKIDEIIIKRDEYKRLTNEAKYNYIHAKD